jgi:hypothetical protein
MGLWRCLWLFCAIGLGTALAQDLSAPSDRADLYARSVYRLLVVSAAVQQSCAHRVLEALLDSGSTERPPWATPGKGANHGNASTACR